MGISNAKITNSDITAHGIVAKPNKLPGPAASNKQAFDELVREVVAVRVNQLIDGLLADAAAGELGVDDTVMQMGVQTVQEALEALQAAITQGSVPPGGITTDKLASKAVTTAKIDDGAVGTGQVANGAITAAKLALPIYVVDEGDWDPSSPGPDGIYLVYEE